MKTIFVLALLFLSGCAPSPVKPVLIEGLKIEHIERTQLKPIGIPAKPKMELIEKDGVVFAGVTEGGLDTLSEAYEAANANTKALEELIKSFNYSVDERNHIVNLAELEIKRYNSLAEQYAAVESQRRYEEWSNRNRQMFYEFLLVVMAIGLVL